MFMTFPGASVRRWFDYGRDYEIRAAVSRLGFLSSIHAPLAAAVATPKPAKDNRKNSRRFSCFIVALSAMLTPLPVFLNLPLRNIKFVGRAQA